MNKYCDHNVYLTNLQNASRVATLYNVISARGPTWFNLKEQTAVFIYLKIMP